MASLRVFFIGLIVVLAGFAPVSASEDTRIHLQASMQRHIERSLIDGAMLLIDVETGDLQTVFPTKAHSVILAGDGYYVMCADVRDEAGAKIPVDYYLAPTTRGFRVFRTEDDNRKPLQRLMKAGAVKKY